MGTAGSTAKLLSEEEGRALLVIARDSLRAFFDLASDDPSGGSPASPPGGRLETEQRGVFVTLTREGRLCGCVGYVEGVKPLVAAVRDLAVSAAVRDGRFEPVEAAEVAALHVEVSVLTPTHPLPQPVDPSMVEIGRHGLVVRQGGRSGLLLPQVAPEWGWDALALLEHTCEKAGLPRDSWRNPGCKVLAFEAQIFDE